MERYWTSNKTINGLRHFVLVNETKEEENFSFLMVSVLDSEINLKTTYEELINSGNWQKGWINLSKHQSITEEYVNYKSCLLYTSPSPRDISGSRMPSSA